MTEMCNKYTNIYPFAIVCENMYFKHNFFHPIDYTVAKPHIIKTLLLLYTEITHHLLA